MKKTATAIPSKSGNGYPAYIDDSNKHLFPKSLQEAFEYVAKNKVLYPERYYRRQRENVIKKVNALWHQNPELPPKEVVRNVLENLPDWLPPANVLEVTQLVLEEWQALSKTEVHA